MRLPVLIVGTGAMACLFAARLEKAGTAVTLLGAWPEGIEAIREHGVRLVEVDGQEETIPVQATDDPHACAGARLAIVLVKSWQTDRAAQQLDACLSRDGLALTLQNGLGNYEVLAEFLGSQRAAVGTTTFGATLMGPGRVRAVGKGQIRLGKHARIDPMLEMFKGAGMAPFLEDDIPALLWGKLAINAAINPLTALLDVPNGALFEVYHARSLAAGLAREAYQVAAAQELVLPYSDPVAEVEAVVKSTAGNISSMLQDIRRGAPTEVDAILGGILKAAQQINVPTPMTETVYMLLKARIAISSSSKEGNE